MKINGEIINGYVEFPSDIKSIFKDVIEEYDFFVKIESEDLFEIESNQSGLRFWIERQIVSVGFFKPFNNRERSYEIGNLWDFMELGSKKKLEIEKFTTTNQERNIFLEQLVFYHKQIKELEPILNGDFDWIEPYLKWEENGYSFPPVVLSFQRSVTKN